MSKESGVANITVTVDDSAGAGQNISNDITSISIKTPRGMQEITGLDKSGLERLYLLKDGEVQLKGVFNDAASMSHAVFKNFDTLAAGQVGRTVALSVSGQTLSMEMIADDYSIDRGANGELTWSVTLKLSNGTAPSWS